MSSNIVSNVTITGNLYVQAKTSVATVTQNLYVAVAGGRYPSTAAASSTDGITWTARTLPSNSPWWAVTVNPNTPLFVAVAGGFHNTSDAAASSTDGITWTARTLPSISNWTAVTVNPNTGVFVAVSAGGTGASSTDAITWTTRALQPQGRSWTSVTVNANTGLFVAVEAQSVGLSTDGITWTSTTYLPDYVSWSSITALPATGLFVAVASGTDVAAYSSNGPTWTQFAMPSDSSWKSITVNTNTGLFVCVSESSNRSAYSFNGITWYASTLPANAGWYSVTVNPTTGLFVAVGLGPVNYSASTTDGITWTLRTMPSTSDWVAVTFGTIQVTTTTLTSGYTGLGTFSPAYQLDLSTGSARKLTTTTWLTGSDSRIKTDIESANLQTCYDVVKSLDLKYFKWNFPAESNIVTDDKHSLGFLAQEVREIFPNAVSESNSYGYDDFLSLNTDQILKVMHGALKKTIERKEALQARFASAP